MGGLAMIKYIFNRKFRLLLACISLLCLLDLVQDTYAKYTSSANANTNFTIARWAFTVNSQDVLSNSNFSNTIVPTIDTNANISPGVIAPTSTGSFEITIDSSNVGVAFDEVITLTNGANNTVSDLVFTGYTKNNGTLTDLGNTNTATITTNHNLGEVTTVNTYHFYIAWIDGANENMNNAADTAAATNGVASIHVNLNFTQRAATTSTNTTSTNTTS